MTTQHELEAAALAEHKAWVELLECERWGPTRHNTTERRFALAALQEERFLTPAQLSGYHRNTSTRKAS